MKKLYFLTNMFPKETSLIYEKQYIPGGENITFIQESIIEGLKTLGDYEITVVNKLLIKQSNKMVKTTRWKYSLVEGINFSYLNRPIFSSVLLHLFEKKYIKNAFKEDCLVLAYGVTDSNLRLLSLIKSKNKNAKVGLIVPDIPEDTRDTKSRLKKFKNRIVNHITNHLILKASNLIDQYYLFSQQMVKRLFCKNNFTVFEGIATDTFANILPKRIVKKGCYQIVYGGGIHKRYGADVMLDAIKSAKKNYIFVLCGEGDYLSTIVGSKLDNVICLGNVSRKELLSLMLGADALINPRTSKEIFSKYSFPSKNMECLSSGVPFIGFKLGGIPDEYDAYINYPDKESGLCLLKKIEEVCLNHEKFLNRSIEAKQYVLQKKDYLSQTRKIIKNLK